MKDLILQTLKYREPVDTGPTAFECIKYAVQQEISPMINHMPELAKNWFISPRSYRRKVPRVGSSHLVSRVVRRPVGRAAVQVLWYVMDLSASVNRLKLGRKSRAS